MSFAKKRLQRRIYQLIRPPVTALSKYLKDRLQRYRDDMPIGGLFNKMWGALNPMQSFRVEERDRHGALRFFSNGWFSDRRSQGKKRRGYVLPCLFCDGITNAEGGEGDDEPHPVAPDAIAVPLPECEDSSDHARRCQPLTVAAFRLGFIPDMTQHWWDHWIKGTFGRTSVPSEKGPVPVDDKDFTADITRWLGALYTLHNLARHACKRPWKTYHDVCMSIYHVLDDMPPRRAAKKQNGPPEGAPESVEPPQRPHVPRRRHRPYASTGVT